MTDNKIIKAFECCLKTKTKADCEDLSCPAYCQGNCAFVVRTDDDFEGLMFAEMCKDLISVINHQKAEVERLKAELKESYGENERLTDNIDNGVSVCVECHRKYAEETKTAKIEAIRGFSEKLAKSIRSQLGISTLEKKEAYYFCLDELCNLTDSMTEGKDEN